MEKRYGGQEQAYLKRKLHQEKDNDLVKIQINEWVIGKGYVPKYEYVTKEEAKRRCEYQNVFVIDEN